MLCEKYVMESGVFLSSAKSWLNDRCCPESVMIVG